MQGPGRLLKDWWNELSALYNLWNDDLWNDDQGQDLIEYTLLLAFVILATAGIFLGGGGSISGIVSTSNSQLVAANASAS
jgi:Flp pilus assembly pilin Flp